MKRIASVFDQLYNTHFLFLYNIPAFVRNSIPVDVVRELCQDPRFAGIKDSKYQSARENICRMIEEFQTKKVDIGKVNNEYFINVLAAGMLTDIAYKVPKDKKAVLGKMAYYLEGVKEFPKQLAQNMTLSFHSKEFNDTLDIMLFLVTNSKSVGGFADAAPLASVSDGYLDVLILKKMDLLFEAPDLIIKWFQGDHPKHPAIEYFQTKELSVLPTEKTAEIAIDYDTARRSDDAFQLDQHEAARPICVARRTLRRPAY